jgi:biopolymer transport protein ExbD
MKAKRGKIEMHSEPPSVLMVDIAFNLLIFFVVCASNEPQDGRKQDIPGADSKNSQKQAQAAENIDVHLTRSTASINGSPVRQVDFTPKLKELLKGRAKPEERIVVVKSSPDTPYDHWINVTGLIEAAGGIITLQMEESREVHVQ